MIKKEFINICYAVTKNSGALKTKVILEMVGKKGLTRLLSWKCALISGRRF